MPTIIISLLLVIATLVIALILVSRDYQSRLTSTHLRHIDHIREMQGTVNSLVESLVRDGGKQINLQQQSRSAYREALGHNVSFGKGWKADRIATPPKEGKS